MNPYGWKRGGPPGTSKKNIPIHKSSRPRTFYTPARRARTFYTPARRARTFYMSAQHFTRPRVARERRAAARGAEGVEPTYSRHYLIFNTFLQFRELTPHMGSIWVHILIHHRRRRKSAENSWTLLWREVRQPPRHSGDRKLTRPPGLPARPPTPPGELKGSQNAVFMVFYYHMYAKTHEP